MDHEERMEKVYALHKQAIAAGGGADMAYNILALFRDHLIDDDIEAITDMAQQTRQQQTDYLQQAVDLFKDVS